MNQDNLPRSEWYAADPAGGRPSAPQAGAFDPPAAPVRAPAVPYAAPGAARAPRKRHTGAMIAGIVVCALLVLVGSVYALSQGVRKYIRDNDDGGVFHIDLPDVSPKENDDDGSLPEDYSDDYKDFFSKSYVRNDVYEERRPSNIERVEPGSDFRIRLESQEGKEEGRLQELYPDCLQSIVCIRTLTSGKPGYYMGSGIIMSEDGYILTNQHLVSETDTAYVTLPDGTEKPALLVGEDASTDLAVLKIEAEGLHPAVFGDSEELTVGDSVFAIGSPILPSLKGTLTSGIISGLSRNVSSGRHPMTLLQHTAPINEGSSGGALFNMYGQVIGITNMKLQNPYSDVIVEGMCFAIPSATAKAVTDQLLAEGHYTRPGIGITVGAISAEDAKHYDLPGGLYITAVSKGSDAAAKGVQPGDILIEANGKPVRETDDLLAIRDTLGVGDILTLTIFRDGEIFDVEVELYDLSELY